MLHRPDVILGQSRGVLCRLRGAAGSYRNLGQEHIRHTHHPPVQRPSSPPHTTLNPAPPPMPTSATPSSYLEAWLPGRDGLQFYTRTYPATFPKAVVLFHHGFAEHCARYEHVHARYPANHITVFAYDGRGFGRTALDPAHKSPYGKTSWQHQLADLEFWAQHLAKEYPNTPLFLMGHSMVRYSSVCCLVRCG